MKQNVEITRTEILYTARGALSTAPELSTSPLK